MVDRNQELLAVVRSMVVAARSHMVFVVAAGGPGAGLFVCGYGDLGDLRGYPTRVCCVLWRV